MKYPQQQDTEEAIIALKSLGWNNSKISRALNINRKKIARIIAASKNLNGPVQDSLNCHEKAHIDNIGIERKCIHCGCHFTPDPRHKNRQKFCNDGACRAASKRHSQQKWTQKNQDYWLWWFPCQFFWGGGKCIKNGPTMPIASCDMQLIDNTSLRTLRWSIFKIL